jgi:arylsulfatase A-like enzyme/uncharacterized membrane protein YbhN (UPF0104 family)
MAEPTPPKPTSSKKKMIVAAIKIALSAVAIYYVYGGLVGRDGMDELRDRLANLGWGWFAAAMVMQAIAIGFAIVRWKIMLGAQGIDAPFKFLVPSFMIGRFWGAFTPGGLGLDGWKLYDVATQTKKPARTVAVTAAEKILGQFGFFVVVMGGSLWGLELMGLTGVLLINAFFVVLLSVGLTFIARPKLFLPLFRLLPRQIETRVGTLISALAAYQGKGKVLALAVLASAAVHAFNNLIYVCAAQAMGLPVTPTVVFFASSIVIMSTIVPISFNGVGVREATAAGVLASMGAVSPGLAAATYTLGFIAEMCVSAIGVPVFLLRRPGFKADITVRDPDREQMIEEKLPEVAQEKWPKLGRGIAIGAGAGLLAGTMVGLIEGAVVVAGGNGTVGYGVMAYGALVYAIVSGLAGAGMVGVSAQIGRWMKREAVPEAAAYARTFAFFTAAWALVLTAFRIRRDVYHEELVWMSGKGALIGGACVVAAALLYFALSFVVRKWTQSEGGNVLLRAWGSPALAAPIVIGFTIYALVVGPPSLPAQELTRGEAPEGTPNVLVIVVDTLRADHLPGYGYENGSTPNLDRFAQDAVRYDQAFSNASWTRPSFASILTGRYPSSHGVMPKNAALSDELVTMPEALREHGYTTGGIVTNYNVAPFYNFQQGFDEYAYLEPNFVLGADDAAAKLLLVQALRQQVVERFRAWRGTVEPGTVYQDGEVVNRSLFSWLDRAPTDSPWFMFVGYMDPHDPYYSHPYDGTGYGRAANQAPELAMADEMRGLYDGEITYWDEQFGRVIADLQRRGLYDDMMIVVTSDHGEEFGEHGGFWHGTTLYDEQLRVPLYVKLPQNARAGTVVRHWVQSIDLMPSILAHVGAPIPEGVQGGRLDQGSERVYAEESHEGNVLESVRERTSSLEELKIITANDRNPRGLAPIEVFAIADDPREQSNIAEADRDRTRGLLRSLEQAREQAREGAVEQRTIERDNENIEQQCRLGYGDTMQCCRLGYLTGEACRGT